MTMKILSWLVVSDDLAGPLGVCAVCQLLATHRKKHQPCGMNIIPFADSDRDVFHRRPPSNVPVPSPVPDLIDVTEPSLLSLPGVSFLLSVSQCVCVCVIQTEEAQFFGLLALASSCAVETLPLSSPVCSLLDPLCPGSFSCGTPGLLGGFLEIRTQLRLCWASCLGAAGTPAVFLEFGPILGPCRRSSSEL